MSLKSPCVLLGRVNEGCRKLVRFCFTTPFACQETTGIEQKCFPHQPRLHLSFCLCMSRLKLSRYPRVICPLVLSCHILACLKISLQCYSQSILPPSGQEHNRKKFRSKEIMRGSPLLKWRMIDRKTVRATRRSLRCVQHPGNSQLRIAQDQRGTERRSNCWDPW